jgi:GxxExxY protein
LPIVYRSVRLDCGYSLDIVIEDQVIVELKTVERLLPIHEAQMLTYLKLSGIRTGLLLNFNSAVLRDGGEAAYVVRTSLPLCLAGQFLNDQSDRALGISRALY